MRALITPHVFTGPVRIPASKSHTIRRLLMAALTEGPSFIENPLDSLDARSCAAACRVLGAEITEMRDGAGGLSGYTVRGKKPGSGTFPAGMDLRINVGNSGTTLFLAIAAASLLSVPVTFTGDDQIARRSAGPLLDALAALGISVHSSPGPEGKGGCIPITIRGPWKGGRASVSCPTSQYLSALLLAAPLAPAGTITEIDVPLLNEKPYAAMTLSYLEAQGLRGLPAGDYSYFCIPGGHAYTPVNGPVPGDFSSAAFPAAAAVITGGGVTLLGLDPEDTQGDKVFFEYLARMGSEVQWSAASGGGNIRELRVSRGKALRGGTFDLNDTPDMLPVLAVLAAYAQGETSLVNAAHARIKETDRIAVMAEELGKLGVHCEEQPGGLVIRPAPEGPLSTMFPAGDAALNQAPVQLDGRGDHRVVMALAAAALGFPRGQTAEIAGAEAADVTYPGFLDLVGARWYT